MLRKLKARKFKESTWVQGIKQTREDCLKKRMLTIKLRDLTDFTSQKGEQCPRNKSKGSLKRHRGVIRELQNSTIYKELEYLQRK